MFFKLNFSFYLGICLKDKSPQWLDPNSSMIIFVKDMHLAKLSVQIVPLNDMYTDPNLIITVLADVLAFMEPGHQQEQSWLQS